MHKSGLPTVAAEGGGTVTALPFRGVATPEQNPADGRLGARGSLAAVLFLPDPAAYDCVGSEDQIVVREHLRGRNRRKFVYTGLGSVAVRAALDVVSAAVERRALQGVNHHMHTGYGRPSCTLVRGAR
ncbi:hypothetical protein ACVH9Z_23645 [Rhodococcus opacus]|uniref:Uncharacterized protein n=1 Tax=Rhodococcus opacus TaxID=37919 RepID=A0AAX3YIG2_RHOOP|nr:MULTISPECIES: hypothetical protein [Rhodococcus]ELB89716.1 hypothetical protein Rwratislav_28164 [Rhodococcus wratislaviensis IFP 2016]NDV09966.1 hypothetical protein [Rhodococcus sp. IEGM 248]NHU44770.1 hypothetical protein [Rhodococcus sp. A14]MBA8960801.1 hypothetical protein [Rhodococcus opacus]MBP2203333.1 hypothetical protein [Rhodococcus opacus]